MEMNPDTRVESLAAKRAVADGSEWGENGDPLYAVSRRSLSQEEHLC